MAYKAPDYQKLIAGWWKPEVDETIEGTFAGADESPSNFGGGGMQTFFGIRKADGTEIKVSSNFNLAKAFSDAGVRIGDAIVLKYLGKKGRAHNYSVTKAKKSAAK